MRSAGREHQTMIHHTVASTFSARRTVTFFIRFHLPSAVRDFAPSEPGKSYGFGLPVIKD